MDLLTARQLWTLDSVWLNTAQYGIPPRCAHQVLGRAMEAWRTGTGDPADWGAAAAEARRRFAALVGSTPADVAQGTTTSQLVGMVAGSLPDGARVVVPEGDYTSAVFPWMAQADRGVRVRVVPLAGLADAVDDGTDVVAFSLVQSATGEVSPVKDVLSAAARHGALTVTDATQAAGWLPMDATRFDAVVCSAYKWLMAPRGLAYAHLSPRLRSRLRPISAGPAAAVDPMGSFYTSRMELADDARRFDVAPNWFAAVAAAESMRVLQEVGPEAVRTHNVALADRFLDRLGLPPAGSPIVTVAVPGAGERLRAAGVRAAERDGRTRLAFHLYSTEDHADLAAKALS
ncbi:selenocysteine lyase/cysteine desulfurase [Nocardiopsis mwathae]|uniref:Selenocysteine lyase/cysteine desulfurase n=1 Tax=Nocardiopsis mwathae TaxID=1472723 RepID=A0A7W9YDG8_9ACTN|nr:aminotransferase class V-fold PLP-dependent enzyme [Nocardiopsis mwathae]MBB6170170.1 selenocysteine lyase/cysteine desulfurase [Nocardiopsis mwathae]